MGTTLVALICKSGVVVGADTRTSVGEYVSNRFAHKLTPLSDRIIVCRSGSAADTQALCLEARSELEFLKYNHQVTLRTSQVAKLLRYYMTKQGNGGDLQASLLCCGVDDNGVGEIHAILPSGALLQHPSFAVSGSGSTYIMGFLDEQLAKRNDDDLLEEDEAIDLVTRAIQLAMDRDGSSGGFVRIYSITSKGQRARTIYPSDHVSVEKRQGQETTSSTDLPGFAPPVSLAGTSEDSK